MFTAQGAHLKLEGGNIELHGPGKIEFKASLKELTGPVRIPNLDIANKISELNIKRDLGIEYVDADGNALTDEPIALHFNGGIKEAITLDESGKATLKSMPLGPFSAKQPKRR
jgi:type VI secretion system secreted protein VgrG